MCGTERKRSNLRRLVLIGGPTCSGKTTLAGAVADAFGADRCVVVPLDAYYRDLAHLPLDERARQNFDHTDALAWDEVILAVRNLLDGKDVRVPVYDFALHVRAKRFETLHPKELIICEGIHALHDPDVRAFAALRIYMDAPTHCCDQRRIDRDTRCRGRDEQSVREQLAQTVHPMAKQYVAPTRQFADLVLDGTQAPAILAQTAIDRIRAMMIEANPAPTNDVQL